MPLKAKLTHFIFSRKLIKIITFIVKLEYGIIKQNK